MRYILMPSLLMMLAFFSCSAPPTQKNLLSYALPYSHSTASALEEATCYFIQGMNAHLTKQEKNTFLLSMHIPDNVISFGGLATTRMNSMNSLIFFNQWPQETHAPGGFIAYDTNAKDVAHNHFVNVLVSSAQYNVAEHSATFILTPQEPIDLFLLRSKLESCLLVIQATQFVENTQ